MITHPIREVARLIVAVLRLACGALVVVYSVRRMVFLAASSRRTPAAAYSDQLPTLALVIACRDEAHSVSELLEAIDETDYPAALFSVVLVDDGSTDGTADTLRSWAAAGPSRFVVASPASQGKVRALGAGMARVSSSDLVGVCDADQRPRRDCWRLLAEVFCDERVAAAAGHLEPVNHTETAVSRYAALETWVHQLVTAQAKDTLGLNPPTHGGAVYRRSALADIGGFVAGISGEDVTTSTALTEAGWTTRFVSGAVIENRVVSKWSEYWHQHVRWGRGVFDTTSEHRRGSRAPLPRRLEGWLLTAGYLDRIGFLGSCLLSARNASHRWLPPLYLATAAAEVWVALARGTVPPRRRFRYVLSLAVVFPVDVAATGVALVAHLRRRPHEWRSPRSPDR